MPCSGCQQRQLKLSEMVQNLRHGQLRQAGSNLRNVAESSRADTINAVKMALVSSNRFRVRPPSVGRGK